MRTIQTEGHIRRSVLSVSVLPPCQGAADVACHKSSSAEVCGVAGFLWVVLWSELVQILDFQAVRPKSEKRQ